MNRLTFLQSLAAAWVLAAAAGWGNAQARTLAIGQVAELSGIANANENTLGAQLWFTHASARGPHQYVLQSLDDQRDPKKTLELSRKLVDDSKVVALFGYRSTPSLEAIGPALEELQVPLVGPFNGADSVRQFDGRWMFFLRATYLDETKRLVAHVKTIGVRDVAIVHQDDPFGKGAAKGFTDTLQAEGMNLAGSYSYDRKTLDVSAAVAGLLDKQPRAVLMACTSRACADVIRKVRDTNEKMIFLVLSNAVTDELLKAIAGVGRGVMMSQVVPFPWGDNVPLVKEFNRLNQAAKVKVPVSHAALEGFVAAKLLTTVASRAGSQPTAQRMADILRTTAPIDLGGVVYDPQGRKRFVDLTMVSREGRLMR